MLSGCQVCDWGIQYHLCSTYREGCEGWWVVWLLWLSGRALMQVRGFLGLTPGLLAFFTFLNFHLLTSKIIYYGSTLVLGACYFVYPCSIYAKLHMADGQMPCWNRIPCVMAGRVAPLVLVANSATLNHSLSAGQSNHRLQFLDTASNQELEPGKLARIHS